MARRQLLLSNGRDLLLVLATVLSAFVLGAIAPGYSLGGETANPVFVSAAVRPDSGNRGALSAHLTAATSLSVTGLHHGASVSDRPRLASVPGLEPSVPIDRFSGEAGGRKETVIVQNAHSRRAYLIETASLMHRRGWIGLDES